jgi:hypothetical protein
MIAGFGKPQAGAPSSFGASVAYVARLGVLKEGQAPAIAVWTHNVSSVESAGTEMELLAARSRSEDSLRFFTASWSPGEVPTIEQAKEAAAIYTERLGWQGLQAVWSLQNDGRAGLYHLHAVVNLVDPLTENIRLAPETGKDVRWKEAMKCRAGSREVEFTQGWERADNRTKREVAREARERGLTIGQLRDLERPHRLLEALTAHQSTFTQADVHEIIVDRVRDKGKHRSTFDAIEKLVVPLRNEATGEKRFTSPAVVKAEATCDAAAKGLSEANVRAIGHRAYPEKFDQQQRDACDHLLAAGSAVKVWLGVGGMGKSYCLDALDEACRANGLRLIATSTDHSLVKQIEEKNPQIPASTIASLLWHWERGKNLPDHRSVFFVDEVSKLGTEWGAKFLETARKHGSRVWLVGDHQFQAVGYGDTLRIVQRYEKGVDFSKTRRQRLDTNDLNPAWMREATEAMRRGEMLAGFQAYRERGFVHETGTEDEARAKTIEIWRRIVADGRECQIETFTNATRVALDELVRPELRAMGKIGGDDVRLRTMDGVHYADGLVPYAVGEKVILRATVREAGMNNGDLGTVRGFTGAVLHIEREDGQHVRIDTRTDEGSMIQHATVRVEYGLQGRTIATTVEHFGPNMSQRSAYTGASRHEEEYHAVYSRAVFKAGFSDFVRSALRSADKELVRDYTVRDLAAERQSPQHKVEHERSMEAADEAPKQEQAQKRSRGIRR